jgi:hypothetical protein
MHPHPNNFKTPSYNDLTDSKKNKDNKVEVSKQKIHNTQANIKKIPSYHNVELNVLSKQSNRIHNTQTKKNNNEKRNSSKKTYTKRSVKQKNQNHDFNFFNNKNKNNIFDDLTA